MSDHERSERVTVPLRLTRAEIETLPETMGAVESHLFQAATVFEFIHDGLSLGYLEGREDALSAICDLMAMAMHRIAETEGEAIGKLAVKLSADGEDAIHVLNAGEASHADHA